MNDITTIKLTYGLGNLPFGATEDEVEAYLGAADEIESIGDPNDEHITWHYKSLLGYVCFDEIDDFRLGTIETSLPGATLNGVALMGRGKDEVRRQLKGVTTGRYEESHHDYERSGDARVCLLTYGDQSLNLWFTDEILTSIQWGYLISEDDEVVWPE
ncbi:MAG: hypothetical protein FD130_1586 [Halothiobacillaceae bacterium]|nr:MAG: hypothetical protein FD130_1586 [Halothiobacillaceae bacterium]